MKHKDIKNTFKPAKLDEILKNDNYESYLITGGEPLTCPDKLSVLLDELSTKKKPVYLYSNGLLLTEGFLMCHYGLIDGVNIGMHGANYDYEHILTLSKYVPIRVHRWEKLVSVKLIYWCFNNNIKLKQWVMDKCDTVNDDRFLLLD